MDLPVPRRKECTGITFDIGIIPFNVISPGLHPTLRIGSQEIAIHTGNVLILSERRVLAKQQPGRVALTVEYVLCHTAVGYVMIPDLDEECYPALYFILSFAPGHHKEH